MNIQTIKNVSDCVPLYLPHSLYLKPIAKLSISVQLPTAITGKTLSNWDVMEKLRKLIEPDKYSALKVSVLASRWVLDDSLNRASIPGEQKHPRSDTIGR